MSLRRPPNRRQELRSGFCSAHGETALPGPNSSSRSIHCPAPVCPVPQDRTAPGGGSDGDAPVSPLRRAARRASCQPADQADGIDRHDPACSRTLREWQYRRHDSGPQEIDVAAGRGEINANRRAQGVESAHTGAAAKSDNFFAVLFNEPLPAGLHARCYATSTSLIAARTLRKSAAKS